jgi:HK97 family phage portal protein
MGLLADRWETVRNDSGWLADDDRLLMGPMTKAGVRVDRARVLALTTIWRCWDLLAGAVAHAPRDVVLRVGGKSFPEFSPPDWLSTPNPQDPSYTGNDYFSQVALSLLSDGNFFTRVIPYVLDPQALIVLDPSLVTVKPGPLYEIRDQIGHVIETVGPMEMLHGTWLRFGGQLRGISPLEAMRLAYGTALATQDHAARFFGQGASLSFGVEVPGKLDEAKKNDLREALKRKYQGNSNSHAIGVLTDGAKFVTGLAPTPEQAQFLASRKFEVEDLCRPHGVPPQLAGSQEPGASSYASAEVYHDEFREYGVLPLAVRIEAPHARLLSLPPGIDPPASVQFKFNLDYIARTNLLARYQAYSAGIMGGFLKPVEARTKEDFQPLADGSDDQLFMQRQMVPLKDLGTTAPIPGAAVDANIPKVEAA